MQALENGTIDAAVLDGVFSRRLKQKGFNITGEFAELKHLYTSQAIVVQGKLLQQRPDMLENLLKAQVEAIAFSLAPKNKPTVIKTFMRRLRIDAVTAEEGYADLHRAVDRKPYASVEGMRNVQRLMALRNPKSARSRSTISSTTGSLRNWMTAALSIKPTPPKAPALNKVFSRKQRKVHKRDMTSMRRQKFARLILFRSFYCYFVTGCRPSPMQPFLARLFSATPRPPARCPSGWHKISDCSLNTVSMSNRCLFAARRFWSPAWLRGISMSAAPVAAPP